MAARADRLSLPVSAPGTRRELVVHRYGAPGARPKAYLHASLHADELPGMLALHHLLDLLDDCDRAGRLRGEIVVVPVANPIGLDQVVNGTHLGRYGLAGGGNFNRGWPNLAPLVADGLAACLGSDGPANVARIREALVATVAGLDARTEIAALRRVLLGLAIDADLVLDLHCDEVGLAHLYTAPACWDDLKPLAASLGCAAVLLAEASGGGPFDECVNGPWPALAERFGPGVPIPQACLSATVELRGKMDVSDAGAERDARAILQFLALRGFAEPGEAAAAPGPVPQATRLDAVDVVRSPAAGILCYARRVGDMLRKGDAVATVLDPLAADRAASRTVVRTITDGVLLTTLRHPLVRAGAVIAKVVGQQPLPTRAAGMLLDD
ncbi:MAG: succinylglutamate desuccinylase/aspartoacylase family protein [Alphaproteobacteria bacterium]|nr:succinylglutamate desuccinylase/aspartoacylase family protein [Alphaproteobacteria bacterium]